MSKALPILAAARRMEEQGAAADAERLYRQALVADPSSVAAAKSLGLLLSASGRCREAMPFLSPLANSRPDPEVLAAMGRCLFQTGQIPGATRVLESALALDRKSVEARVWLARCRVASNRPSDAVALLAELPGADSNPDAQTALGLAFVLLGRVEEGIAAHHLAAALRPSAAAFCELAWALNTGGRVEESLASYDRALALEPSLAAATAGKANILESRGETEPARALIRSALDHGVLDPSLAVAFARLSNTREQRPAARAVVERTLTAARSPVDRASLLFALGRLRESDGDYDGAFSCFKQANDFYPPTFDPSKYARATDQLIEVFSRQSLSALPRASNADPRPVFIVGMPRSGTSLVEQILASHPSIHGAGELDDLSTIAARLTDILGLPPAVPQYPACIPSLRATQLDALAERYLSRIGRLDPTAARTTDKMPSNFALLGLIDLLFPGARIIHCTRNPLDTCLSCYTTQLSQRHSYRTRLKDLAAAYKMYERLMSHWRTAVRTPMLEVRYEDVIADPERQSRAIVEFVGVPWDDRCLRFYENRRIVHTASIDQVRRPLYNSSIGRWRHFERHLGELIAGLAGSC